ncbi:MAG TPA: acetylornithine/succinylornithine family transaminase [Gemmatimonadales bacterium]|nr:acetylornithine/succinylornithine family transaminase [Gemmatimonadales bacterium]
MATATIPVIQPVPVPEHSEPAASPTHAPATAESALLGTYRQPPLELVRGRGVELFDADGRSYLDFTSGIGVMALGHDDPGVHAAMQEALNNGLVHVSNLFRTSPGEKLAQALVERSFADKVFFCNSGAEANEGAFKFARRWAGEVGGAAKHEIVSLRGAFHGRLMATVAATDRAQYRNPFRPLAGGISICERDIESLAGRLSREATAALILEPVQGESGVRVLDAGFLREVRALTAERDIALILDEVQCGLGRTGTLFAYEQAGIEPDMMTLAKPLAGGLPMGAILLRDHVARAVRPGDHGSTFGGGPFVASVALHVLNRVSDPALLQHVRETGGWMGGQLRDIAARTGNVRAVRGRGFMWGMDVHRTSAAIVAAARESGLLLVTAGDYTIRLLPPLTASREELARGLAILESALQ